jgi:photosystem II stability/assembly factor-like uncharacterized protein
MAWLHAVYFLDQDRGWIAGANGTLLSTVDGGATWSKTSVITKDAFTDVYFSDSVHGWLLAQRDLFKLKANERSSYLLNTDDGGITWRQVFLNTEELNARFTRMLFRDQQHGWVFGETGAIFATSDGGEHWMPQRSPTKHLLLGGAFANGAFANNANNDRGLIVGAGATIMQSDDGAVWRLSAPRQGESARLNAVTLVGNSAWAVGNGGQIFATADGGRSWFRQHSNVAADLLDVRFIDAREGWAVAGDGTLLHTSDGGLHWGAEAIGNSRGLERLFIIDRNHIWAVGFGGTILRFGETNAPRLK